MKRHLFLFALMTTTELGFLFAMDASNPKVTFTIAKDRILEGRSLDPAYYDDERYELPINNKTLLILLNEAWSNESTKNQELISLLKKFGTKIAFPFPKNETGTTHLTAKDMNAGLLLHIYQVGESIIIGSVRACTPVIIGNEIAYLHHSLRGSDREFTTELKDFSKRSPKITSSDYEAARQKVKKILEKFQR